MSGFERSVIVADYDVSSLAAGAEPSGRALVQAAAREGYDRVVVHARSTSDGWAVVHRGEQVQRRGETVTLAETTLDEARVADTADGRISTLETTMLEAHRKGIGLVVRIHDTLVVEALSAALGIMAGDGHGELRARYLVIVPDARIGKRLRLGAAQLPSGRALPVSGGGWRAAIARRLPNFARAAADADDLVVHSSLADPERVRKKLVPMLARRGAYVWVEGVSPEQRPAYEGVGAGGLLVETPYPA